MNNGIPDRCDIYGCQFQTQPLIWNGQPLSLILDHINGVNTDNRPENLRYVCPNCNSNLPTHGGGNKNRVKKSGGGFALRRKDGKMDYTLVAEPGRLEINMESAAVLHAKVDPAYDAMKAEPKRGIPARKVFDGIRDRHARDLKAKV